MLLRTPLPTAKKSARKRRARPILRLMPDGAAPLAFRETAPSLDELLFRDALAVREAEYWLKLGRPKEALLELVKLSAKGRKHLLAIRDFALAIRAIQEMRQIVIQE